tara:strand:+ start:493 stop:1716 length:1224 start_codon:yes stop_codon:yes gene_type:complete
MPRTSFTTQKAVQIGKVETSSKMVPANQSVHGTNKYPEHQFRPTRTYYAKLREAITAGDSTRAGLGKADLYEVNPTNGDYELINALTDVTIYNSGPELNDLFSMFLVVEHYPSGLLFLVQKAFTGTNFIGEVKEVTTESCTDNTIIIPGGGGAASCSIPICKVDLYTGCFSPKEVGCRTLDLGTLLSEGVYVGYASDMPVTVNDIVLVHQTHDGCYFLTEIFCVGDDSAGGGSGGEVPLDTLCNTCDPHPSEFTLTVTGTTDPQPGTCTTTFGLTFNRTWILPQAVTLTCDDPEQLSQTLVWIQEIIHTGSGGSGGLECTNPGTGTQQGIYAELEGQTVINSDRTSATLDWILSFYCCDTTGRKKLSEYRPDDNLTVCDGNANNWSRTFQSPTLAENWPEDILVTAS